MRDQWRNRAIKEDTEDKSKWLEIGVELENRFVRFMALHSHIDVRINPAKEDEPTAPDLYVPGYGLCDLKTQQTPFFTAGRYGISPEHAFTINAKDIIRYRKLYPKIGIFIWLNWENNRASDSRFKEIPYKWGVYFTTLEQLIAFIDKGVAKEHSYQRRATNNDSFLGKRGMNSSKNASSSYVLDSRWLDPVVTSVTNPWTA